MTVEILRTDSKNVDFIELTKMLDEELTKQYGELQTQYDRYNKVDDINNIIIISMDKEPVACGACKEYDTSTVEMKRIFVKKEYRNQGMAKLIMNKLEETAKNTGFIYAVLETGIKQCEAINLYKSIGYEVIQNFKPYIGNENSICMKKAL